MDKERLRELQFVQMKIMDEIHKICIKNHLRYYLIGGSALGAVRHKGFIPWDVDIDIAMPRKDYELFVTGFSKDLPHGFSCIDYRTNKDLWSPHALVVMNGTKLVQKDAYLNPQLKNYGIFVDILPLDQCPLNNKEWERQKSQLKFWSALRYRKLSLIYSENGFYTRLFKRISRRCFSVIPMSYINKKLSGIMQRYDYIPNEKCIKWCSMASHYRLEKLIMPKEYFGNPVLTKFENREYYVPEKIDFYLSHLFGDYMKLPSVKEQKAQMDWFIEAYW